ncbi:MAG: indole-3-glycerol phosphate synthase TrpC [Actinomycetota bacterium]|nr:indole-3-glycerol phosphate synthase TrpC [Actinomycetota bacterium]
MGFLSDLVSELRRELDARPSDDVGLHARARAMPPPRDFEAALSGPGTALIAEVKRASPSAGHIADAEPAELASEYERGGASAISVLTEPRHFGGSLDDLRAARASTSLPLLRKDFLVHPGQVAEARLAGADAVLLITGALSDDELTAMLQSAKELQLSALVEAHTASDLERALASGAQVVGVNARDLETLDVDEDRALELLARIPADRTAVFESGVSSREQVRRAEAAGAAAVLVGEALMRAASASDAISELLGQTS